MPKKSKPAKRQLRDGKALRQDLQDKLHPDHLVHPVKKAVPLYRQKLPKPKASRQDLQNSQGKSHSDHSVDSVKNLHFIAPAQFTLREDGSVQMTEAGYQKSDDRSQKSDLRPPTSELPRLTYSDNSRGIWLYHGNCLELLDAIAAKYPEGRFDAIFADPPYFLSNGGITCHAGKMVKVDKGDWDVSRGPELNHEFNTEWLRRCQRVLKPNGTIWVTGTHHVIFSIGYALQQLGFKILNDIAWEKPNPPPNLSCRYFTHSTETVLWAAKNDKSKHVFNYQEMRKVTGKQMKTVWTIQAPRNGEKAFGKHPTQKPTALVERCILASTNAGDLVLDPFMGAGTTGIACIRMNRQFVGIELDSNHAQVAESRIQDEIQNFLPLGRAQK